MKNDIDLIRKILTTIYERTDLDDEPVDIHGYDALLVARHVERLYDDGFIDGLTFSDLTEPYKQVLARDLTSAGHNFLDALKNDDVWNQVKSALSPEQLGTLSLRKLAEIAGDLLKKYLRTKLGLAES